jgi:hypothetical protein
MLLTWLRKIGNQNTNSPRRSVAQQRRPRQHLALEPLEDRVTPTVIFNSFFGPETQKPNGGASLSSPPIFLIFWGSYWGSATSPQALAVTNAAKEVINSSFFTEVEQYGSSGVPVFGGVAYDPSNPVSGFNQGQSFISTPGTIESVVQNQVYHGPLPRPNATAHLPIYVVITPPGITSAVNDAGGYNFIDHEFDPSLDYLSFADVWASTNYSNTPNTLSVDAFSTIFSHEIAESMSDPGGGGFEVNPGARWAGGGSGNQIGDYEGNALTYRLADGGLVQPLWSRANINWVVTDGNSENFYVNTTAADWKGSSFQGAYDALTIVGSQQPLNFDDDILVNSTQIAGQTHLQITENGQSVQFPSGTVKNLVIDANNLFDTVDIESAPGSPNIVINSSGPGEADITTKAPATIYVSNGVANIDAQAATTINAGNQTVILSGAGPVVLNGTTQTKVEALQLAGAATINGAGVVQIGDGVNGPLPASTVTVNGSTATQITVRSSAGKVVVAGAAASVNVGQGQTAPITGLVDIALTKGTTALTVDDSQDSIERDFFIRGTSLGGFANPLVAYNSAHLSALTLKAGEGSITTVGGDNLATLPSTITIVGDGTQSLIVDGTSSLNSLFVVNNNSVQHYTTTISRSLPLHTLTNTINYSNLTSLTVVGDTTAGTAFTVLSASPATPVSLRGGAAADSFQVGSTSTSLSAIQSLISVNGNGGADTFVVDDQLSPPALTLIRSRNFEVTNQAITWSETTGISLHPIPIIDTFQYTNIPNITIYGNNVGTTYSIPSTAAGTTVSIIAGSGNDSVSLGDNADSLDGILGPVVVNGGGGSNSLVFNDTASTAPESYTINGSQLLRGGTPIGQFSNFQQVTLNTSQGIDTVAVAAIPSVAFAIDGGNSRNTLIGPNSNSTWTLTDSNAGVLDSTIAFQNFANLQGGSGNDTFAMDSIALKNGVLHTGGGLTGTLDGGSGANVLDYSAYAANITVDLQLGSETGLNQILNVQKIIGSQGNDIMVGDGGVTLQGGTGRNILIAGPSPAKLLGNTNQDILIGGTTDYDLNVTALKAILAEWTRTDLGTKSEPTGYQARVNHLLNGGGLNGNDLLNVSTFHANVGGNTLTGGAGLDLFYGSKKRDSYDWNATLGEQFIEDAAQQNTQIDARALPFSDMVLDGTPFATADVESSLLTPGTHTLSAGNSTGGITFTVAADGTVDYDPALDNILSGRGTTTLVVHGTNVTIDASDLTTGSLVLDGEFAVSTAAPYEFTAFPGTYTLGDENAAGTDLEFEVADDGTVHYSPSLEGILTGEGTTTLAVHGISVTVDLTHLSTPLMSLDDHEASIAATFVFSALPGTYTLLDVEASAGASLNFTVNANGTVHYDPTLEGILTGAGSSTLVVHGVTVTVDTTHLSTPNLVIESEVSVSNTAPFAFSTLPGTFQLMDGYASGSSLNFSVNADGTVSYDPSIEGIVTGAGTATLTVLGATVTVDATPLTSPILGLDSEIPLGNSAPLAFTTLPGTYTIVDDEAVGASVQFTVAANGTVSYDPSLEGILTGSGTSTLTVHGITVTIDATHLSLQALDVDDAIVPLTSQPFTFSALPGQLFLADPQEDTALYFTINQDGTIGYDPSLQGIFTGSGTNTLVVNGLTVTIDATRLSLQSIIVDDAIEPSTASPFIFTGLPGSVALVDDGEGAYVTINLNADGTVSYDPSLEGVLSGSGSSTLVIHGVTVSVDATRLSVQQLIVDNAITPATSAPFSFTGLPGLTYLSDYEGAGATLYFTLNANGSVSYDPSLEGILSGSGTNSLVVNGVTLNIDATALSPQVSTITLYGVGSLSTAQPQTVVVLPGEGVINNGTMDISYAISAQDSLDYDASLDDVVSGSGSNTLKLLSPG